MHFAPLAPLEASAAVPPVCQARRHRFTDIGAPAHTASTRGNPLTPQTSHYQDTVGKTNH
ncbi:hypothetical protein GCM10023178_49060 [Actinomadura luteofluorescens]